MRFNIDHGEGSQGVSEDSKLHYQVGSLQHSPAHQQQDPKGEDLHSHVLLPLDDVILLSYPRHDQRGWEEGRHPQVGRGFQDFHTQQETRALSPTDINLSHGQTQQ